MNRIYTLICLLFVIGGITAQENHITGYEYWMNNDYSLKKTETVSPVKTFHRQTTISCEELSPGIHTLNVRFHDENGTWSPTVSSYFYKLDKQIANSIVEYEYWTDDLYEKKTAQKISSSGSFLLEKWIAFDSLEDGLHAFHIRFKDKSGLWSPVVSSYFYKKLQLSENNIVAYEYWLDNQKERKRETITPSPQYTFSQNIALDTLSNGIHSLNVRFKDATGKWSSTVSQYFNKLPAPVDNKLIAYEYWVNEQYDKKYYGATNGEKSFVLLDQLDCSLGDKATNYVHFRFKDATGKWSPVVTKDFYRPVELAFTTIVGLSEVTFTNLTKYADKYEWDFGDGSKSSQVHPMHTYAEPGAYLVKLIAENKEFKDSIDSYVEIEGIRAWSSNKGGNRGYSTIIFYGGGLTDKTQVTLYSQSNQIKAEKINISTPGELEVEFNLQNASIGLYDIILIDETTFGSITLKDGYAIEETVEPKVWTEINGRDVIMDGRWQTYTISYGNTGNIDALFVPIWLAFSDVPNFEVEFIDFEVLPPVVDYEIDENLRKDILSSLIYIKADSFQNQAFKCVVYPLVIPKIPANYTGQVSIRLKTNQSMKFKVWIDDPLVSSEDIVRLRSLQENNNPKYWECLKELMEQLATQTGLGYVPVAGCLTDYGYWTMSLDGLKSGKVGWGSFLWSTLFTTVGCLMDGATVVTSPTIVGAFAFSWAGFVTNTVGGLGGYYWGEKDCERQFPPNGDPSNSEMPIRTQSSFDPNELVGTSGYSVQNYINKRDHLNYTVFFENDAEKATAPAQEIFLTDTLDITKFDPEQFSFGTFTFRDITVEAIPGIPEFSTDIDMRSKGEDIIIRISATFNKVTGIINWHLIALDPVTMDLTENPSLGILYPNTDPPVGEGHVTYRIGIRPTLADGTVFTNQAHIVFDLNEPISTNEYINTFDITGPESHMNATYEIKEETKVSLSWSGEDSGSGIRDYSVYVAENEGNYSSWLLNTTQTVGEFEGVLNNTYKFYVVATDNVGNQESVKPEAELILKLIPNSMNIPEKDISGLKVTPSLIETTAVVEFYQQKQGQINLSVYSVTGQKVMEIYDGQANAGMNQVSFDAAIVKPGVYLVILQTADVKMTTRIVVR